MAAAVMPTVAVAAFICFLLLQIDLQPFDAPCVSYVSQHVSLSHFSLLAMWRIS